MISKSTDEKALKLLKQLDEKLLSLNDVEKQQAFIKNQVVLVDKYLKQFLLKNAPKNGYNVSFSGLLKFIFFRFFFLRFYEFLERDQNQACNSNYKTKFYDRNDAIKRLSSYHVFQRMSNDPTLDECNHCN